MTKEDLQQWHKNWENKQISGNAYALFLNVYIAKLEQRTCNNCEHWAKEHSSIGLCKSGIDQCSVKDLYEFTTRPDFGCNKFS